MQTHTPLTEGLAKPNPESAIRFLEQKRGARTLPFSFAVQAHHFYRSISIFFCLWPERRSGASAPAPCLLATSRRCSAGVAFHAGAVTHQCIIAAISAGVTFITLHFGLAAQIHFSRNRGCAYFCFNQYRAGSSTQLDISNLCSAALQHG